MKEASFVLLVLYFLVLHLSKGVHGQDDNCFGDLASFIEKSSFNGHTPNTSIELDPNLVVFQGSRSHHNITLDCQSLQAEYEGSRLDILFKLVIIIPGYHEVCSEPWVELMTGGLFSKGEKNIICLDWSKGSKGVPYKHALSNTQLVGEMLFKVLKFLEELYPGFLKNVYLIASDMGAHAAGLTGRKTGGEIGRITGLDPSGLYLGGPKMSIGLVKTDAKFVDVIHTDAGWNGDGEHRRIGDIDYYAKQGGTHPMCAYLDNDRKCHHRLSIYLYIESLGDGCPLFGFLCKTYNKFILGQCKKKKKALMGYGAMKIDSIEKRYFGALTSEKPLIGKQLLFEVQYEVPLKYEPPYILMLHTIFKSQGVKIERHEVLYLVVIKKEGKSGHVAKVIVKPLRHPPASFFIKCTQIPSYKNLTLRLTDIKTTNLVTHHVDIWRIVGAQTEIKCGVEYKLRRKDSNRRIEL